MKKLLTFLCCWTMAWTAGAQTPRPVLTGTISDAVASEPLPGASILVVNLADTSQRTGTVSDMEGRFRVTLPQTGLFRVRTSYVGYTTRTDTVSLRTAAFDMGTIALAAAVTELDQILVRSTQERMIVNGDTTEYNAASFRVNRDASAEELVLKLPGITVQDGQIQAHGEAIRRVLIDGREYFTDDPEQALKNLPAEVIARIQVYDRKSEQAEFTGFEDGEREKTLNIVTRSGRANGRFGKAHGGYGTGDRYTSGLSLNLFSGPRRLTLTGSSNNVNEMPGEGRSGRISRVGVNQTNAFGFNYIDQPSDALRITGNYNFSLAKNQNEVARERQYVLTTNDLQNYSEQNESEARNYGHRANFLIRYTIDPRNSLSITPRFSVTGSSSDRFLAGLTTPPEGVALSRTSNQYESESFALSASTGILYRHRFPRAGRTISAELVTSGNDRSAVSDQASENWSYLVGDSTGTLYAQRADSQTGGLDVSADLAYTEPIGKNGQLLLTYRPSISLDTSDRLVHRQDSLTGEYDQLQPGQSNQYDHTVSTQRGGLDFRTRLGKVRLMAGVMLQEIRLEGEQTYPLLFDVRRRFTGVLPSASVQIDLARSRSIRIHYRTSTRTPSISQLQAAVDNDNPLFVTTGNPDLRPSHARNLSGSLHMASPQKGRSFSMNFGVEQTDDQIGTATLIARTDTSVATGIDLVRGARFSRPMNLDGSWNARSFFSYGMPVHVLKSNLNIDAGLGYSRFPNLQDGELNRSDIFNWNVGASLGSNMGEHLDFRISAGTSRQVASYSLQPNRDRTLWRHTGSIRVVWAPIESLSIESDARFSAFVGESVVTDPANLIWNAGIGYKMLPGNAGELRLAIVDILDQNGELSRSNNALFTESSRSQVLGRYLVLYFTYRLRDFTD